MSLVPIVMHPGSVAGAGADHLAWVYPYARRKGIRYRHANYREESVEVSECALRSREGAGVKYSPFVMLQHAIPGDSTDLRAALPYPSQFKVQ